MPLFSKYVGAQNIFHRCDWRFWDKELDDQIFKVARKNVIFKFRDIFSYLFRQGAILGCLRKAKTENRSLEKNQKCIKR